MLLGKLFGMESSPRTCPAEGDARPPPKMHVVFGTALLSTANITKLALQCILIPVLARLLGPSVFGLMSIAMSFVLLANMLSDGGMGAALIRERHADHVLESTVYWLSACIGLALAAIVALAAWPLSIAYGESELFPILLALAPILIVSSVLSVANARIVREQRFDVFAAGDIGSAIASAGVGLALAFAGWGVWSLVLQQLVFWAVKAYWICWFARFRPSLTLRLRRARPLLRFSANNLAANIAEFASKNIPVMVVGGVLSVAAVARYSMAYQLTRVAEAVVSDPVNVATFAGVAASPNRHEAAEFSIASLRILMLVLAPLFCGLALTADLLAPIVLGERWTGTGPALAALAPGAFLLCLYRFATAVLLGRGHAGRVLKLTVLTGAATSVGTLIGVHHGVIWAIWGLTIGAAVLIPVYVLSLTQVMRLSPARLASAAAPSVSATVVMAAVVLLLRFETAALVPVAQLAASVLGGAFTYLVAAFALGGREVYRDIQRLRRRSHQAEPSAAPSTWRFLPNASSEGGAAPVESGP